MKNPTFLHRNLYKGKNLKRNLMVENVLNQLQLLKHPMQCKTKKDDRLLLQDAYIMN